jgi:hypothetical protein
VRGRRWSTRTGPTRDQRTPDAGPRRISAAEQIGKERIAPVIMLTAFSSGWLVERAWTRASWPTSSSCSPGRPAPAVDDRHGSRWAELKALEGIADSRAPRDPQGGRPGQGILMTRSSCPRPTRSGGSRRRYDRRLGMREVVTRSSRRCRDQVGPPASPSIGGACLAQQTIRASAVLRRSAKPAMLREASCSSSASPLRGAPGAKPVPWR